MLLLQDTARHIGPTSSDFCFYLVRFPCLFRIYCELEVLQPESAQSSWPTLAEDSSAQQKPLLQNHLLWWLALTSARPALSWVGNLGGVRWWSQCSHHSQLSLRLSAFYSRNFPQCPQHFNSLVTKSKSSLLISFSNLLELFPVHVQDSWERPHRDRKVMQEKKTSDRGYNRNSQEDQWSGETEPRPEIHGLPPQVKRENYQMAGLKTKRRLCSPIQCSCIRKFMATENRNVSMDWPPLQFKEKSN